MGELAILLVVLGAVAAAIFNIICKFAQQEEWRNRSALVTALANIGAALFLLAYSFATGGPQFMVQHWWFPVLATGVLNIGILYGKMRARALEEVSLVTPIDSTTPAVVILTSMIILGEYPTRLGWLGIWLMVVGTYILNIDDLRQKMKTMGGGKWWQVEARAWLAPFSAITRSSGVRWAFFSVALSTISLNYDGLVARQVDVGFGFGLVLLIAALGNAVVAVARREYRGASMTASLRRLVGLGFPLALAIVLTGLAFQLAIVPYVGTMKRVGIPMTIVLSYYLLNERKSFKERLVGGLVMVAGAILIALA